MFKKKQNTIASVYTKEKNKISTRTFYIWNYKDCYVVLCIYREQAITQVVRYRFYYTQLHVIYIYISYLRAVTFE